MTGPGLVATDVRVSFRGLVALDGAGLTVPPGRITGLIGPNGAGKTTLFNVCCGYVRPDRGSVVLDGHDLAGVAPARRARRGLGRTFQRMELFRTMTVRQNVEVAAEARSIGPNPLTTVGLLGGGRARRRADAEWADELLDEVGLGAVADMPAGALSTGQGRLVELARALARRPTTLLLDEPSSGLDVAETEAFGALLGRVVDNRGIGILLVEHDMSLVLGICAWVHVLEFGRPLAEGTPGDIRADAHVRAAYLGSEVHQ